MTSEDIVRMAREAGATPYTNRHYPDRPTHTFNPEQLERFAALIASRVAAEEREACAEVCESLFDMDDDSCDEAEKCAAAIRARGNI